MAKQPLQITASAARRAKFTTHDVPGKVFQPGEKGYHGPRTRANYGRYDNAHSAASYANLQDPHATFNDPNHSSDRKIGYLVGGIAGLPVAAGAAAIPGTRRRFKRQAAQSRAKQAALAKAWKGDQKAFHAEDPGIRHAQQHRGAWRVHSMKPGLDSHPAARLGRFAMKHPELVGNAAPIVGGAAGLGLLYAGTHGPRKDAERAQRDLTNARRRAKRQTVTKRGASSALKEHFGTPKKAIATLGRNPGHLAAGGVLGLAVASRAPGRDRDRTPEQRQRVHRASNAAGGAVGGQAAFLATGYGIRQAGHKRERWNKDFPMSRSAHDKIMRNFHREQGVPSNTKPPAHKQASFYRNYPADLPATKYKRALGHMSGAKGRAIQAGAIGGGALIGAASTRGKKSDFGKGDGARRTRNSVLTGAAMGAGAYEGIGLGQARIVQNNTHKRNMIDAALTGRPFPEKPSYRSVAKPVMRHWNNPTSMKNLARNMPREAKLTAVTTGGAALTGALLGAGRKKQDFGKGALYERTSRPSILRTTEAAAGLGLAAWGLGRSRMVGNALGHGIKMAQANGSHRAYEALRTAQAAQGALRRGTAPGERALRQIQAVDRAVRAVPRPLRGDVAAAAGILLVGNSQPIRRNTYRPIPAPSVPYRTVGW